MDEQAAFQEAVKLAQAFLNKEHSALETGRSMSGLGLVHLPCWDALGGAHGPLSYFYGADDDADKQHFLGNDVERWHPSVIESKRAALAEAEQYWEPLVQTACDALTKHAANQKT
jgi:hypothetical protein